MTGSSWRTRRDVRSEPAPHTALDRILFERGVTRTALARELGVSVASVSRWASGNRRPSLETIRQMAALLGVSEQEITG